MMKWFKKKEEIEEKSTVGEELLEMNDHSRKDANNSDIKELFIKELDIYNNYSVLLIDWMDLARIVGKYYPDQPTKMERRITSDTKFIYEDVLNKRLNEVCPNYDLVESYIRGINEYRFFECMEDKASMNGELMLIKQLIEIVFVSFHGTSCYTDYAIEETFRRNTLDYLKEQCFKNGGDVFIITRDWQDKTYLPGIYNRWGKSISMNLPLIDGNKVLTYEFPEKFSIGGIYYGVHVKTSKIEDIAGPNDYFRIGDLTYQLSPFGAIIYTGQEKIYGGLDKIYTTYMKL